MWECEVFVGFVAPMEAIASFSKVETAVGCAHDGTNVTLCGVGIKGRCGAMLAER